MRESRARDEHVTRMRRARGRERGPRAQRETARAGPSVRPACKIFPGEVCKKDRFRRNVIVKVELLFFFKGRARKSSSLGLCRGLKAGNQTTGPPLLASLNSPSNDEHRPTENKITRRN